MAIFADDGALYRAEVLDLNKARGNIVRYIDFGNCAMVETRNTYRVEKRFMKLPKQAVNCSLKNIVSANGSSWSKANNQEIDKCFDADSYECSFHEISDGKYTVSLSNNGVDVAGSMVDKSIASFAVSGPVVTENNGKEQLDFYYLFFNLPAINVNLSVSTLSKAASFLASGSLKNYPDSAVDVGMFAGKVDFFATLFFF